MSQFKILFFYFLNKSHNSLKRLKHFALKNTREKNPSGENEMSINNLIVSQAAKNIGVSLRRLADGYFQLEHNGKICYSRSSDFSFENLMAYKMCGNKHITAILLSENKLPVPTFRAFSRHEYDSALDFFLAQNKPMVVKPCSGTSSAVGISIGVTSRLSFLRAFAKALCYSSSVMVEEYVQGDSYRFTVLNSKVLTVVHRIPAHIVGNGLNTVADLISRKNRAFFDPASETRLFEPITVDGDVRSLLRYQGLTLKSVPANNVEIMLRRTTNASQGGEIVEVTNLCHSDYLQMAVKAANLMRTTLSGIDIIAKDISSPFEKGTAFINEVNTTPGLRIVREPRVNGELDSKVGEEILAYAFNLDI